MLICPQVVMATNCDFAYTKKTSMPLNTFLKPFTKNLKNRLDINQVQFIKKSIPIHCKFPITLAGPSRARPIERNHFRRAYIYICFGTSITHALAAPPDGQLERPLCLFLIKSTDCSILYAQEVQKKTSFGGSGNLLNAGVEATVRRV